jgi:hypothetical protein
MKFLTQQEFENLLNKLSMNKNKLPNNNQNKDIKLEKNEKLFYEVLQIIQNLCESKKMNHSAFGISMTLFQYYIAINEIRLIDKFELAFACFYMSSKIQIINIPLNEVIKEYKEYIKNKLKIEKKADPDFVKYEIQLYSQLGYDLDIETPYDQFYSNMPSIYNRFPKLKEKNDKIKCFCFNLIDDTYTRPLSIYYHPKIIFLSCFIFTIKFLDLNDYIDIDKLIEGENLDLIGECMENINSIYAKYIENNN